MTTKELLKFVSDCTAAWLVLHAELRYKADIDVELIDNLREDVMQTANNAGDCCDILYRILYS